MRFTASAVRSAISSIGLFLSCNAFGTPIGLTESDPAASAKQILLAAPGSASGFYWFDPDGAGADSAFSTYADMTTAGGGWMLGMHSIRNSEAPSTDITQNLGASSLANGFTRDLSYWAVDQPAEIRHRLVRDDGLVLFDGYYTGKYHDPLGSSWTILAGSLSAGFFDYHIGKNWSSVANDNDFSPSNCATFYGNQPWYYGNCWAVHPTGFTGQDGPKAAGGSIALASYDIYIRELQTPALQQPNEVPEPVSLAMFGLGLACLAIVRRTNRHRGR